MKLRLTTIYALLLLLLSSSDATVPARYAKQSVEWFQSEERRTGYAYYGGWATKLLTDAYPQWREKHKFEKK